MISVAFPRSHGTSARLLRRLASVAVAVAFAVVSAAADTPPPSNVTVAGSLQSEAGCAGDWQPDCATTHLVYDPADDVWQRVFTLVAGDYEYKAALNDSWTENYGRNAQRDGANIPLSLASEGAVKFYYDHKTHWITDNRGAVIAVAPGSFQSELGCPGDWDPSCLRSWLQDPDGDGIFGFDTRALPKGNYEAKVALNESWDVNYGAGGVQNGPNIPFEVPADCTTMRFRYDGATHVLSIDPDAAPAPQPASVTIAGSLQSELGCPGDWQPDCATTHLTLDAEDGVWQGTFSVPAGAFEYKAALNDSWAENYGANARRDGPNIPLGLAEGSSVKFYYDNASHWITSNKNATIAVVPGSFQSELGCNGDWDPSCLRSWLQDPDGDGIYTFSTRSLPAGNYEAKVALNESWDVNYGAGGVQNGPNIAFTVPAPCTEVFFNWDSSSKVLTIGTGGGPKGNLSLAQAHWVTRDTIAWKVPPGARTGGSFKLHHAAEGGLKLTEAGVEGGASVALTLDPAGLPAEVTAKFPHLATFDALKIDAAALDQVPAMLKGQVAVSAAGADTKPLDATSLQIPGVLDDLYTYDGPLGVTFSAGVPSIHVWAPTARSMKLRLFADSSTGTSDVLPMSVDAETGVWSITGDPSWRWKYFQIEVEVFVRPTGKIETNVTTDPYSYSLSRNSGRSQIVDLDDPALKPAGWDNVAKPPLEAPEDIVLYELHVRDFSAGDPSVPDALKGTFKAFALPGTRGVRHLRALAFAGVTHVHLLPSFDIASVDEDKTTWREPEGDLESMPPDSEQQQAAVAAVRDVDGFNWGYDPWHYTVPEGSYATDPDGPSRIREFREMVQALNANGLRVVMDVVYNHTTASGQNPKSVLDKIVPGYYYRLNADGAVETSTCCQNTASEHAMMEKLLVDSAVTWAKAYKVDGFRFDLMGHHMKSNMLRLRAALDALTPANAGVEGRKVYVYGEGWNFGEVANNARGVNATQLNMAGTGIGTFNDRLRDGARGGGPFSPVREQGFLSGLWFEPNGSDQGSPEDQKARLLRYGDWIRAGLAGSVADYRFQNVAGEVVPASSIDYNGQPAGYTSDPQEVINYVSAHDNETLFDAVQLKTDPVAPMAERIRRSTLGVSLVAYGQGIPFFHAGDEILRSKSMDRNSYNSGDWFNKLDFTYASNNWGIGLPPADGNQSNWAIMKPLLADPALAAGTGDIGRSFVRFLETIAVRKSTALLRLRTGDEIRARVRMYNTGPDQIPGLVVMAITATPQGPPPSPPSRSSRGRTAAAFRNPSEPLSGTTRALVPRPGLGDYERVVVLFNAASEWTTFRSEALRGLTLKLHPLLKGSTDPLIPSSSYENATGTFRVPPISAAVFVCCGGPDAIRFNVPRF